MSYKVTYQSTFNHFIKSRVVNAVNSQHAKDILLADVVGTLKVISVNELKDNEIQSHLHFF